MFSGPHKPAQRPHRSTTVPNPPQTSYTNFGWPRLTGMRVTVALETPSGAKSRRFHETWQGKDQIYFDRPQNASAIARGVIYGLRTNSGVISAASDPWLGHRTPSCDLLHHCTKTTPLGGWKTPFSCPRGAVLSFEDKRTCIPTPE